MQARQHRRGRNSRRGMTRGGTEGADRVQAEPLQLLDDGNLAWITAEPRRWWVEKPVPRRYTRARVVSRYKTGRPHNLDSYRPISLLTTL